MILTSVLFVFRKLFVLGFDASYDDKSYKSKPADYKEYKRSKVFFNPCRSCGNNDGYVFNVYKRFARSYLTGILFRNGAYDFVHTRFVGSEFTFAVVVYRSDVVVCVLNRRTLIHVGVIIFNFAGFVLYDLYPFVAGFVE